jgi:hypothetical protein
MQCVCQNGKFLKVAACGTYTGALNSYVAKPVNLSVQDPYELSSLNIENNSSVMKIVLGKESRFFSEIHTRRINTICKWNVEFLTLNLMMQKVTVKL